MYKGIRGPRHRDEIPGPGIARPLEAGTGR